jgi:hypothetical protein
MGECPTADLSGLDRCRTLSFLPKPSRSRCSGWKCLLGLAGAVRGRRSRRRRSSRRAMRAARWLRRLASICLRELIERRSEKLGSFRHWKAMQFKRTAALVGLACRFAIHRRINFRPVSSPVSWCPHHRIAASRSMRRILGASAPIVRWRSRAH